MEVTEGDPLNMNDASPKKVTSAFGAQSTKATEIKTGESELLPHNAMNTTKASSQQPGLLNGTELTSPFQLNSKT